MTEGPEPRPARGSEGDDPLELLKWQDELLQILYWYRGEGLGQVVEPRDLRPFLPAEEAQIRFHLERLVDQGYVQRVVEGQGIGYRLTEQGVVEGGRRFADAFAGLTGQAHGECNDPDCACKVFGPEACGHRP